MPQIIAITELRQTAAAHQLPEHPLLRGNRMAPEAVDGPSALRKPGSEKRIA